MTDASLKIPARRVLARAPAAERSRRLKRDERRRFFIEEAAKHFADHGFSSSTPELAKALGVAQSLLYKYYAGKDDLIEDVYRHISPTEEMYEVWVETLSDRSVPIRARLVAFYLSYTAETWSYLRARIMIWANLFKPELNRHYHGMLESRIIPLIARELRVAAGGSDDAPPSWRELEMVRSLHGGLYHMAGHRRWIAPPPRLRGEIKAHVELHIDLFIRGARDLALWG